MEIGEIETGKFNRCIGWFWIALTIFIGMYSAMNIEHWIQNDMRMTKTMVRHAHTMGIIGAVINVVYGIRIGKVNLDDNLKKVGSILALLGMVGITLIWPGILIGIPSPIAALIGIMLIVAVLILGYGEMSSQN